MNGMDEQIRQRPSRLAGGGEQLPDVRWEQTEGILETDSACQLFSSVFPPQPQSSHSSCGVCCPVNLPKASRLRLPKMLLNGGPFHSPVRLLMAFSPPESGTTQSAQGFWTGEGCRKAFKTERKMFLPRWHSRTSTKWRIVSGPYFCYWNPQRQQKRDAASKVWGFVWHLISQDIATLPLLITVRLQETKGGREVCMVAQANGDTGSNKAGLLTDLPLADPVCLWEFMATVWGRK